MKKLLAGSWQTLLFRGIIALLFGIMTFAWPHITLIWLIYVFAFYAIADGLSTLASAWKHRKTSSQWGFLLLIGIISLLAGILTLIYPHLTAIYLIFFIGFRAIFDGIVTIVAAIRLRKEIHNEGWMIFSGIISIVFGVWVVAAPGRGALALLLTISVFAIAFGIMLIGLSFRARGWAKTTATTAT
ncbi:MAG: hypothetical protein C5B59_11440 [Bacteroidetes bacterium]|nr:MAG: hypothetical protein C5B59_11440 [Bacteroidota bacterium]